MKRTTSYTKYIRDGSMAFGYRIDVKYIKPRCIAVYGLTLSLMGLFP